MINFLKKWVKNTDGIAATEFAFIVPILLVLLIGTLDGGLYIREQMRLHNAARATADYIIQSQDIDSAATVATASYDGTHTLTVNAEMSCQCSDGIAETCPINCDSTDDYQRRYIDVTVGTNYSTTFSYPRLPSSIPLEGDARMRVD